MSFADILSFSRSYCRRDEEKIILPQFARDNKFNFAAHVVTIMY